MLAIIVSLGAFIRHTLGMWRFVLPAVLLDALTIAALATTILQICLALGVDYSQPVATIQKRLQRLRQVRIRYIQGVCFTSALLWFPMFVVFMKAFLGVDVYRTFDMNWIRWNVFIGLAVLVPAIWLVRKFGERLSRTSWGREFLKDLAGVNLKAATGFLDKIAQFERESEGKED